MITSYFSGLSPVSQLRFLNCVNGFVLSIILICVFTFSVPDHPYIRFGPSDDLVVVTVGIHTYEAYAILIIMIFFVNVGNTLVSEFGSTALNFLIYNPDKVSIEGFTRWELEVAGNLLYIITDMQKIFLVLVSITQIDIAVVSMVSRRVVSGIAIHVLLKKKQFSKEDNTPGIPLSRIESLSSSSSSTTTTTTSTTTTLYAPSDGAANTTELEPGAGVEPNHDRMPLIHKPSPSYVHPKDLMRHLSASNKKVISS